MGSFLSLATRAALERLLDLDSGTTSTPLARIEAVRTAIGQLDDDAATLASVREAIEQGAGWDAVAAAAGLKPAAAKWRWQGSDDDIHARHAAGRKRAVRPSSVPTDLPGYSVADAARRLGVTPQAIYLKVSRGSLESRTVALEDGRSYKRVFLDGADA